jgi:hypothetical protein
MTIPLHLPLALRIAMRVSPSWRLAHPDGAPYLTRTVLAGTDCLETHDPEQPFHAFVHQIHTADGDRHLHDHPWAWAVAVVLSGGYTEQRVEGAAPEFLPRSNVYRPGDFNLIRPWQYHSVVEVLPDTCTLFVCGPEISDWGFLVDGEHVPHAEYFKRADVQAMSTTRIR